MSSKTASTEKGLPKIRKLNLKDKQPATLDAGNISPLAVLISLPIVGLHSRISRKGKKRQRYRQ